MRKTRVQEYIDSVYEDIEVFDDKTRDLVRVLESCDESHEEDYDALVCKVFSGDGDERYD
jgi:cell division septum initiation protein DivIVA